MEKRSFEFIIDGHDDGISYYHSRWNITNDSLENTLMDWSGKKVKLTLEILEEEEEDLVTVTYKELFRRANTKTLNKLGVNIYYLNEGGEPTAIKDIPKSIALEFMSEEEFEGRKVE